jgi:hypothetical protein
MSSEEAQELTAAVDTLAHLLHEQRLTAAVEALAHQTRQLNLILDELRDELIHAVRNPHPGDASFWRPVLSSTTEQHEEDDEEPMPVPPPPVRPTGGEASSLPVSASDEQSTPQGGQGSLFR